MLKNVYTSFIAYTILHFFNFKFFSSCMKICRLFYWGCSITFRTFLALLILVSLTWSLSGSSLLHMTCIPDPPPHLQMVSFALWRVFAMDLMCMLGFALMRSATFLMNSSVLRYGVNTLFYILFLNSSRSLPAPMWSLYTTFWCHRRFSGGSGGGQLSAWGSVWCGASQPLQFNSSLALG